MSMESAKSFIERLNTDAEFAKRAMAQKGKEQITSFLKESGYQFSKAEYNDAIKSVQGTQISDESLDKVSGGIWSAPTYIGHEKPDFTMPIESEVIARWF